MLDQFIGNIMVQLIKRQIIIKEDEEIYFFGIKTMFIQTIHILLVIIMGFCIGLLLESILFLLVYLPLRVNAGGYHAPNNKWCFTITIFMNIFVLMVIKYLPIELIIYVVGMSCLIIAPIIFKYAPIENIKKPLDMQERKAYATRTHWILSCIIAGILIAFLVGKANIALVLTLSLLSESAMIFASFIQNKSFFHHNT